LISSDVFNQNAMIGHMSYTAELYIFGSMFQRSLHYYFLNCLDDTSEQNHPMRLTDCEISRFRSGYVRGTKSFSLELESPETRSSVTVVSCVNPALAFASPKVSPLEMFSNQFELRKRV
jgi:hypothetical protein